MYQNNPNYNFFCLSCHTSLFVDMLFDEVTCFVAQADFQQATLLVQPPEC